MARSGFRRNRLALMEGAGLVKRKLYCLRPKRYEYGLTKKGLGLVPVLQEICRWANYFVPGTWTAPPDFMNRNSKMQR
jgi:DNA-binding HxlR family transcriptional regulator